MMNELTFKSQFSLIYCLPFNYLGTESGRNIDNYDHKGDQALKLAQQVCYLLLDLF
jgi:hypothetical protein